MPPGESLTIQGITLLPPAQDHTSCPPLYAFFGRILLQSCLYFCTGNFLRSNPDRLFPYPFCPPYDCKISRNLANHLLSVIVEYLYQEHWQMLQIPLPIISPI